MYTLHSMPDSAGTIIRIALEELGLPYTLRVLDRAAGDLESPAFRAISPFGLVPVMETPDGVMFETGAILLWLADRQAALAPAVASTDRALFLTWFIFVTNTVHPTAICLFYPERYAGPVDDVLRITQAKLRLQLAELERVAPDLPALAPGSVSILAIYVSVLLRWIAVYAADPAFSIPVASHPALQSMAAKLETRPTVVAIAAAEGLGPTPFSAPLGA